MHRPFLRPRRERASTRCRRGVLAALAALHAAIPLAAQQQPEPVPAAPSTADADGGGTASPAVSTTPGLQVKPPLGKLVLLFDRRASLVVTTDSLAATNLRVAHTTLQEASTGQQVSPRYLRLCIPGRCGDPVTLRPRTATRVELEVDPAFAGKGTFTGTVFLVADERPAILSTFDLTILSTTRTVQAVGAAIILLGIVIALVTTVWLRHRAVRLQTLFPAVRLAEEAVRLGVELTKLEKRTGFAFPLIHERLDTQVRELGADKLEARGFLPGVLAGALPASDTSTEYRQFLEEVGKKLQAVAEVMLRGIRSVEKAGLPPDDPKGQDAVKALDDLGAGAESPEAARAGVEPILAELGGDDKVRIETLEGLPAAGATIREVSIAFHRTNAALWLTWAVVTWVGGIAVLIASNRAFGAGADYWTCFFWGLGIQVTGNQLQQLTPASVATAFSISFPRG